jgi:hypothetical protein
VNWEVGSMVDVSESDNPFSNTHVFPNPTSGYFRIISQEPVRASICNLQGDVLIKTDGPDVDIANLSDGIYLVKVYSGKGILLTIEKIIKY